MAAVVVVVGVVVIVVVWLAHVMSCLKRQDWR